MVVVAVGVLGGPPLDDELAARERAADAAGRWRTCCWDPCRVSRPYDAVVLAGGRWAAARRGGQAGAVVGGRTLLDRVLTAVADAATSSSSARNGRRHGRCCGPARTLRAGARRPGWPPGCGLVEAGQVVVLAADLPFLDAASLALLREAAALCRRRGPGRRGRP